MIEADALTKRYGSNTAVNDISFSVRPGRVTGFLGPNGAGKSTTMRMIVGLDRPTNGRVTVNGKPYTKHHAPLAEVGALLEAKAVHTSRSAYHHLRALAASHGIRSARVTEVIELTGLSAVAHKRVGGFSLGMGQRLGIAAALLGDPRTLILDEPVNGLDPEGVKWVRTMVRDLAEEGRTVFLSSHLMSEMALTADDLIIIGRGQIVASGPIQDVIDSVAGTSVRVRSPQATALAEALRGPQISIASVEPGLLEIDGVSAEQIGERAARDGFVLHELTPRSTSLEEAYMRLTVEEVEYHSGGSADDTQTGAEDKKTAAKVAAAAGAAASGAASIAGGGS